VIGRRAARYPSGAVAKKVRTPPPPKRVVQAPKVRTAPRDVQRDRKILYAIGASGFLMLAAVVAFFVFAGRGGDDGSGGAIATIREAGWTYRHPKGQGRDHVLDLEKGFKYNSVPPTSGQHSPQTAIYGVYGDPVSEINYVHNLEHGAIGIQYGPKVPEQTVARIQEYYREDPNGLIVAPHPKLGDQIALTAWTHIATGKTFDEEVFDAFVGEFGFEGPESCTTDLEQGCVRRSDMAPGNP
jgi:Protein of unknown function (DUF3105)